VALTPPYPYVILHYVLGHILAGFLACRDRILFCPYNDISCRGGFKTRPYIWCSKTELLINYA